MSEAKLAPCGIDCSVCDIRRAKSEPEAMKTILDWFRNERKTELRPEQIACDGCFGDRAKHWSADCWILKCAVDDRHHDSCSACDSFPCGKLEEWSRQSAGYGRAFARLKKMREDRQAQHA